MKQILKKIWELALPYNDFRDDNGFLRLLQIMLFAE